MANMLLVRIGLNCKFNLDICSVKIPYIIMGKSSPLTHSLTLASRNHNRERCEWPIWTSFGEDLNPFLTIDSGALIPRLYSTFLPPKAFLYLLHNGIKIILKIRSFLKQYFVWSLLGTIWGCFQLRLAWKYVGSKEEIILEQRLVALLSPRKICETLNF